MEKEFLAALTAQNNLSGAAQLAHWNSEGENFFEYHLLFERIYEIAKGKIDLLAEQARGKGIQIKASIFSDVPEIDWDTCQELAKEVKSLVDDLCDSLKKLHAKSDENEEYGILSVIEDILSDCNTMKYLLGSVNSEF